MLKLKGKFLGQQPNETKKGGFIRKFLCAANNEVYMVYSKNRNDLTVEGDCEISVQIQEMVFCV